VFHSLRRMRWVTADSVICSCLDSTATLAVGVDSLSFAASKLFIFFTFCPSKHTFSATLRSHASAAVGHAAKFTGDLFLCRLSSPRTWWQCPQPTITSLARRNTQCKHNPFVLL